MLCSWNDARGGSRTRNHPGLSRAAPPVGVPGRSEREREPWDSNPQAGQARLLVFKTRPSSGRLAPSSWRSLHSGGWNRTSGLRVQSAASRPTATAPDHSCLSHHVGHCSRLSSSGGRARTCGLPGQSRVFLPSETTPESARASRGIRTRVSGLGSQCLATRPGTRLQVNNRAGGEGVEPSRLIARPRSRRLPSPVGLPPLGLGAFVKGQLQGRDSNPHAFLHLINSQARLPVSPPWNHANFFEKRASGRSDLNRRSPGPEPGGVPGFPTPRGGIR